MSESGKMPRWRVISYGGGVQSTALLVLAIQGRLAFDAALFANVGDDSEHPATLRYVRNVAAPYARDHGFPLHELHRVRRNGESETLVQRLHRAKRSVPIPVRMSHNGAPGNRQCTGDFKIAVVRRWLRERGATKKAPATVAIGFSVDEVERASNRKVHPAYNTIYPLLDLEHDRSACRRVIEDAGLPVPPKSACFFCPFQAPGRWAEMRRDEPDLFRKSEDLERLLIERRTSLGKDPVYFTRFGKPLGQAIVVAQKPLFDDLESDAGCAEPESSCWT